MSDIKIFIVALLLAPLFIYALSYGIKKQDRVYCEKLAVDAQKYDNFYITAGQEQMCTSYSIAINAPIKS